MLQDKVHPRDPTQVHRILEDRDIIFRMNKWQVMYFSVTVDELELKLMKKRNYKNISLHNREVNKVCITYIVHT